ncbi:HEAT repeat domain-containing protein [Streptomyces sp. NPDC055815]
MPSEDIRRDEAVRRLARGLSLARAIDVTRASAWTDLDRDVRTAIGRGTLPERPFDHALPDDPTEAQLALALCEPRGRIREAALAHAGAVPAVLPLVAIRTTDWARPVRERARAALAAALPAAKPAALAVTVPVILRIRRRQRAGEVSGLLDEVLRDCPASALAPLTLHRDRLTRRLALGLAMERGMYGARDLARIAANDPDVAVQDRAATAAVAANAPDETLPLLLEARSGQVRAAGVTALQRAGRHQEAEPFLHDRSGIVRACARWVLRQEGIDPLPLHRAACANPDGVPDRAPLGLAECGERAVDAPVLWELSGHGRPLVRAMAVAGLRLLDAADWARLLPLLDDPAPAVVREAARALLPWADWLPEAELVGLTSAERPWHVRMRALQLLGARGGPVYVEAAQRLAEDPDPVLRARVRNHLGW